MTARLVMTQKQIDADRGAWLKARTAGITASEMGKLLGIAPDKQGGPFSLYHAKVSGIETEDNDAMMRGRWLEPYVDERFAADHPHLQVLPGGLYRHNSIDWLMATFDRLAYDDGAMPSGRRPIAGSLAELAQFPIEIKTAGSYGEWGDDSATATIPVQYRAQCLIEMEVWGADEILIPVLFIVPWWLRTYRLSRDMPDVESDITLMIDRAEEFRGRLARRDPPPIDWTPATSETLRKLHPSIVERDERLPRGIVRKYEAAKTARDRAKQRYDLMTNIIRDRMGDAHHAVDPDGRRVATRIISDAAVKAHTRHMDYIRPGKAISDE